MKIKNTHALLALIAFLTITTTVQAFTALPFPVSVEGTPLTDGEGKTYVTIASPVTSHATIEIGIEVPTIIVNVYPSNSKAEVDNGAVPEIILVNGLNRFSLNQTMSQNTLKPGTYLMNIVAGEGTARVVFTVK
ncbi:MAG: hypothetical protein HQM16_07680 [Deltaproteobacteria bacterium]|nr:hypothetical protein [Deltaproteobacteria bacterium]